MIERAQVARVGSRRRLLVGGSALALFAAAAPLGVAYAQPAEAGAGAEVVREATLLGELVVTASRREETVSKLPFTISAYGGEQLERANISNVAQLTRQVPNFAIQDNGPRTSQSAIPIIRGLNASAPTVAGVRYFQSPVGFYLDNAPMTGSLPLFDVQRVEVLRGPQGTLYGAGALSGAVRIVPAAPNPAYFEGSVSAWGGLVSHSEDKSYGASGIVNVPINENLAIRINARHEYEAGFVDYHDVLRREGDDYLRGAPVLADPTDVAGSPGVYFDKKDGNFAETTSARVAVQWTPSDLLEFTAAYNYAYSSGEGSNIDNNSFRGGPSPIDPRVILRPTGDYERSLPTLEPWERRTELATIDASYDLGFATLSTTLAYGKTKGSVTNDSTVNLLGTPYGAYYTGVPANPRTVIPNDNTDTDRSYTEEVRLVSASGGSFDYTVGAFFQQQRRDIGLIVLSPGADVQSAAANGGSLLPIAAGGTYVPLFPDNSAFNQFTVQKFRDYSLYGDLTWHVTDRWQITGGARVFHQTFEQSLDAESSFFFFVIDSEVESKTDSQIFKLNTSYRLDEQNQVYATWSQGYRRGGANAFVTEGPTREPEELLLYEPDKTNNYELGVKGTLYGLYYSAAAFFIEWDKPQVDLNTPINLTPVVVGGGAAESKGVELEVAGPIGLQGLSFTLGLAYAKAQITDGYALPIGDGQGGIVEGGIGATDGDPLPGAPDWSGAVNLNYERDLADLGTATFSLGVDFRGKTAAPVADVALAAPQQDIPPYALWNGSMSLRRDGWQAELYASNLFDERVRYSANNRTVGSYARTGDWGNVFAVPRPREIGLRLTRNW